MHSVVQGGLETHHEVPAVAPVTNRQRNYGILCFRGKAKHYFIKNELKLSYLIKIGGWMYEYKVKVGATEGL